MHNAVHEDVKGKQLNPSHAENGFSHAPRLAVLRVGTVVGLGYGQTVAQAVTVTQVHAWGFTFRVLNGGWTGDWRTDGMMKCEGGNWLPSDILYVQREDESLPLHYGAMMDYMEEKLKASYTRLHLVMGR